ncbi:PLP-dependent transferase-6 [Coleophoma cylindrospora]|uniref:PLP-dependent transferase-6 n=1 Tax=Coleophoma cylindrospora TaxID=1849047 RepID=A0A3D8QWA9_9HELO|nr:PLP-dependent transferase-6 [Coleophoma cylindrospora]
MDTEPEYASLWDNVLETIPSVCQEVVKSFVSTNQDITTHPIVALASIDEAVAISKNAIPTSRPRSISSVLSEAETIFSRRIRMDHPHFFGFIPSPATPVSFVGDMITSAANTHAGSWLQSSGPSTIERSLISWLATVAGLPNTAGGLFLSGGSMANLTALMLARDSKLGSTWQEKARGVAYVSDQTHSSVAKGLRILGFENTQIRKVKSDNQFRLDVDALEKEILSDRAKGLLPFLIVASCGTTNTGSVDPLHALAKLARTQFPSLWLHVDGAYGASVALSKSYKHLVDGLGEADSISWDAHKWLFQTYGCGMVLVRDGNLLRQSFATEAEYVRDAVDSGQSDSPNYWNYGPELTRPARAMKLWFTLQVFGLDGFGAMIDHGFVLAETAEAELRKLPDWTILSKANMAILNFRFEPKERSEEELDEMNMAISQQLILENIAAILTTKLLGKVVLRICSISPKLSKEAMRHIIARLDTVAREREGA